MVLDIKHVSGNPTLAAHLQLAQTKGTKDQMSTGSLRKYLVNHFLYESMTALP